MAIANLRVPITPLPTPDTSWLDGLTNSVGNAIDRASQNKSFAKLDQEFSRLNGAPQPATSSFLGALTGQPAPNALAPVQGNVAVGTPNDIQNQFIGTVRSGGLTNPYGLAAVAATGRAESGWSPKNVNAAWPDPSQSGQAGTAGGILSWRNERLANLRNFAQSQGADPSNISPELQAKFFLQEDPTLIQRLNAAKSPQEAASIMASAWKFRGYDQPGGEAARRAALAQNYYANEFRDAPVEVASLNPASDVPAQGDVSTPAPQAAQASAAGFDPATATPAQLNAALGPRPQPAYVDPVVTTAYRQTPPAAGSAPVNPPAQSSAAAPVHVPPQATAVPSSSVIAQSVAPIQRGQVPGDLIRFMLQDPNLRDMGLALWKQNAGQSTSEPWQFVTLPDGTLARANQSTGAIETVGRFAKPQEPVNVSEGSSLVNPQNGSVVFQGHPKPPTIQEFFDQKTGQSYKAQWDPTSQVWQRVGGNEVKQPLVTVNNGANDSKFTEESDKAAAKRFDEMVTAGQNAPQTMADMQQLLDLGQRIGTGKNAQIRAAIGPYADALGIKIDGLDDLQAYEAITSRLAPQMRAVGSGSSSDRDVAMFMQSLPNLRNTPGGNEIIANTMKAVAQNKINAAAIARQAQSGKIKWQDADEQISKLPDPYELFKQFSGSNPGSPQKPNSSSNVPSAMPTATGPSGEKIQWNGTTWVPLSGAIPNANSNVNRVPTGN